jgi:hypothetical protein
MPSPYQPLTDFLAAQPPETVSITLTLPEVEVLVGTPLPVSAWARTWWSNARQGRWAEARPWVTAGWRVSRTAMRSATPAVTFARVGTDSTA